MPSLKTRFFMWFVKKTFGKRFGTPERMAITLANARKAGYVHKPRRVSKDVVWDTQTYAGCETAVIRPKSGANGRAMFYLHGGAYIFEAEHMFHSKTLVNLVRETGATVYYPRYPLAPEFAFDHVQEITLKAYEEVSTELGYAPMLAGDSAGGGLAVRVAQMLRDKGAALPETLFLLSPWVDCSVSDPRSKEVESRDPMSTVSSAEYAAGLFAGDTDPQDPRVSPIYGDLSGLPETYIYNAGADVVGPDSIRLNEALVKEGVKVHYDFEPDLFHVYPVTGMPESRRVIEEWMALLKA